MEIGGLVYFILGVACSYAFYRLALRKTLSFLHLVDDQPLSRVNSDVRNRLVVRFFSPRPPPDTNNQAGGEGEQDAREVGALQHLQFILMNSGLRGIKFEETPTLEIAADKVILDASIVHKHPADLKASINIRPVSEGGMQQIHFAVPLLNRGEYVLVKLLLSEAIDAGQLRLHLVAEDLPRQIVPKALPPDATRSLLESIEWSAIFVGSLFLACALAMYFVIIAGFTAHPIPEWTDAGLVTFKAKLEWIHLGLIVSSMGDALMGGLGAMIFFGIGFQSLTHRNRIVLPPELRPNSGRSPT